MKRLIASILLVIFMAPCASALAATGCPKTTLSDVEDEVMCLVCGVPLGLATEAPQANRERAFIQREADACKSKQQIKNELVAAYGERVLALPPDKGFNVAAYVVPALIVVVGAGAIATVAYKRKRSQGSIAPTPVLAGKDAARLEADLERYDL